MRLRFLVDSDHATFKLRMSDASRDPKLKTGRRPKRWNFLQSAFDHFLDEFAGLVVVVVAVCLVATIVFVAKCA